MNKKILFGSLLVALMLIVPLSTASVPRGPSSISNEVSCTATTNIIELTRDELSQLYDALGFLKEQDPALYITVEQALNDAITPTDGGALLDLEILEEQFQGMQGQQIPGPGMNPEEPELMILFFCSIDITDTGENGRVGETGPFLVWSAEGQISIKGILREYITTVPSGGFFMGFIGDWAYNPVDIDGFALIAVVYPIVYPIEW